MEVYRRLWPYLVRYRWRLLVGIVFVVLQTVFQVRIPIVVGETVDFLRAPAAAAGETADTRQLSDFVLIICFLGIVSVLFLFLKRWLVVSASRHVEFAFRNDFFKKILSLSQSFFDKNKTGDIMARATNDLESVRQVIGPGILYPINSVAMIFFAYYEMIRLSAVLALVTLAPALGLFAGMRFFGKRLFLYSKNVQDQFGELNSVVQENLAGMRTIRAYVREASEEAKFDGESRTYIKNNLKLAACRAAFFPSLLLIVFWGMGILLFIGGWMVSGGLLTLGDLIAFFGIMQLMIWPLIALGWIVSVIQRGAAAMSRMTQVLDAKSDTADREKTISPDGGIKGHIEYRNLTFHYPGAEEPILQEIDITVTPGGSLGLIGPTGSGKTTLVSLLERFHRIDDSQLLIDGVDINDYAATQLRQAQGIVTQETFLFSDTIANNIAFASSNGSDQGSVRERVEECARQAQLTSEVDELPDGYDTLLGERGINLSGGQKQRVAIARALFRDPRILILDDSLAAVDAETESHILENLRRFMAGRATLLVSHRVSTVMPADEIIFLDEGRIIERGTHQELLELNGRYAKLHRQQLLASEIEMMNNE